MTAASMRLDFGGLLVWDMTDIILWERILLRFACSDEQRAKFFLVRMSLLMYRRDRSGNNNLFNVVDQLTTHSLHFICIHRAFNT
jgi:hypothetical protein